MIRHSKSKNVGILFETLSRAVVDAVAEKNSKQASRLFFLIKKHYLAETEIRKAYKVYSQLLYNESKNPFYASSMLNHLLYEYKKVNKDKLHLEINSLIEGINRISSSKKILGTKIKNFRLFASFKSLAESTEMSASDFMKCETCIYEHFQNNSEVTSLKNRKPINIEEENMKKLAVTVAIRNIRSKFKDLNEDQIDALIKFVTIGDKAFSRWAEKKVKGLSALVELKKSKIPVENTKFKLETVIERLNPIIGSNEVTTSQLEDLLSSFELEKTLKLL